MKGYINKERMINLIKDKIDEGYDIIANTTIENKEIGRMFMDMFELNKTLDQLEQEEAFDKEMADREMTNKEYEEIQDALNKNKEVEVNE